jgi:valyl-tRNA synthetase
VRKHQTVKETKDLRQDVDALDTWFSLGFGQCLFWWNNDPESEDFKYYYPTNDLVTGPDILFFWVARMIIAGYEYTDKNHLQMYI